MVPSNLPSALFSFADPEFKSNQKFKIREGKLCEDYFEILKCPIFLNFGVKVWPMVLTYYVTQGPKCQVLKFLYRLFRI